MVNRCWIAHTRRSSRHHFPKSIDIAASVPPTRAELECRQPSEPFSEHTMRFSAAHGGCTQKEVVPSGDEEGQGRQVTNTEARVQASRRRVTSHAGLYLILTPARSKNDVIDYITGRGVDPEVMVLVCVTNQIILTAQLAGPSNGLSLPQFSPVLFERSQYAAGFEC